VPLALSGSWRPPLFFKGAYCLAGGQRFLSDANFFFFSAAPIVQGFSYS